MGTLWRIENEPIIAYASFILHRWQTDPGNFIPFIKVKQGTATEKLQRPLDVRNHRLNEAYDSRFTSNNFGYHRQCYQSLTSNLDRLAIKHPTTAIPLLT